MSPKVAGLKLDRCKRIGSKQAPRPWMIFAKDTVLNLIGEHPPAGNAVVRIRVGIQRKIDAGILRKSLVVARNSIDEQLSFVVAAVGHVEKEKSIAW